MTVPVMTLGPITVMLGFTKVIGLPWACFGICVTVNVSPAMVRVPVREVAPGYGSAEKSMVALPVPLAFPAMCRKEDCEVAVHAALSVRLIAQVPPSLPRVTAVWLRV
jgi:hypothetical protein